MRIIYGWLQLARCKRERLCKSSQTLRQSQRHFGSLVMRFPRKPHWNSSNWKFVHPYAQVIALLLAQQQSCLEVMRVDSSIFQTVGRCLVRFAGHSSMNLWKVCIKSEAYHWCNLSALERHGCHSQLVGFKTQNPESVQFQQALPTVLHPCMACNENFRMWYPGLSME